MGIAATTGEGAHTAAASPDISPATPATATAGNTGVATGCRHVLTKFYLMSGGQIALGQEMEGEVVEDPEISLDDSELSDSENNVNIQTPAKPSQDDPVDETDVFLEETDEQQESDIVEGIDVTDLSEMGIENRDNWLSAIEGEESGLVIEEIAEPESEYRYAAFDKPDPFQMPILDGINFEETQGPSGSDIPIISPLQKYPIEELAVKGIYSLANGEMRAMVMTPRSEGIIIQEGDPISAGKVLKITKEYVRTRQYHIREDGIREYKDRDMLLRPPSDRTSGYIRLNPGKTPTYEVEKLLKENQLYNSTGEEMQTKELEQPAVEENINIDQLPQEGNADEAKEPDLEKEIQALQR